MITVHFILAHSFNTMARREPVAVQAFLPPTVQALCSFRVGKDGVWFTHCVDGLEPEIHELWNFAEDGTRKVHPFARIKISDNFSGETFHTDFVSTKELRVPLLGQRSVNGSVEWIDVPQPFFKTGVATAAWAENLYVNPWKITGSPARSQDNPFNLRDVARRARDDLLRDNFLERFQTLSRETLSRETLSRCLSDTRDEILSDDNWLGGVWDLAY